MKRQNKFILLTIFIILGILSGIFILHGIYSLSDRLSKTHRVKADLLIVEGWLPNYAIKMAYDEFNNNKYSFIVTTGLKNTSDYFNISSNDFLTFYINPKQKTENKD